jgi:hypothetical protein
MEKNDQSQRQFYQLAAKNQLQIAVFALLVLGAACIAFLTMLPVIESTIEGFLRGHVTHDGTERTAYIGDEPEHSYIHNRKLWDDDMKFIKETKKEVAIETTDYYKNWAIDLNMGTPNAVRFWINPFFSFFVPSIVIGIFIAAYFSAIMPLGLGLVRRLIEREIVYNLDKICYHTYSYYSEEKNIEFEKMILAADIHDLHIFQRDWGIPIDELKIIHAALKWKNSTLFYRMIHPLKGLNIYVRLYFTEKYSNPILGLVYIGAAILIIIIGLRGLKFIPATQPSPILFSLGVEFTLLLVYAFTLLFAKPEKLDTGSEQEDESHKSLIRNSDNARDIENVLRTFLKTKGGK